MRKRLIVLTLWLKQYWKGWQRLRAGKVLSSSYRLLINHQSIKYFRTSEKRVPIELDQYEPIHWEDALNREVQGKENIIHIYELRNKVNNLFSRKEYFLLLDKNPSLTVKWWGLKEKLCKQDARPILLSDKAISKRTGRWIGWWILTASRYINCYFPPLVLIR